VAKGLLVKVRGLIEGVKEAIDVTVAWLGVNAELPERVAIGVVPGDPEELLAPDGLLRRVPEGVAHTVGVVTGLAD
jgi:hypothetical protein